MSKRTKPTSTSERKREANRKNAQLSTGPKTEQGKDISRLNSLKHGLLARALPLRNLPFWLQEDEKDLEDLLGELCLELRPQGRVEEMLVERIGCVHFQLSRLYRFQTAITGIAMYREFGAPTVHLGDELTKIRLRELPDNLARLFGSCKQECVSNESFSAELMKEIGASALNPVNHHALQQIYQQIERVASEEAEDKKDRIEKLKRSFVATLAFSIFEIVTESQNIEEMIEELTKARFEQHLLPDEETLRKISRYESMLDRELHRCLDRLERMQARRGAELQRPSVLEGSGRRNHRN